MGAAREFGGGAGDRSSLEAWRRLVRRRLGPGLTVFVGVAGLAAAVVFLSRPVYRAEARLRLGEPPPMSGVSPGGGLFALMRLGGDPFSNDLELLASRSLAEAVVEDVALNVALEAPRGWHRDSLLVRLEAGRATKKAAYEARWQPSGAIRVLRTAPTDSVIGTVGPGERVEFGGVSVAFRPWRDGMPRKAVLRTQPFGEAVRRFRGRLVLERARREANVLDLSFDHADPAVARAVVGAAVDRFVALRAAVQRRESGQTVDSLRRVADATLRELAAAESELGALQRRVRLVAPDALGEALIERYAELSAELEKARLEHDVVEDILARADGADAPGDGWSGLAAVPELLESTAVSELLGQLRQLQGRRAELAWRRATESRVIAVVDAQIRELDATLRSLAATYLTALEERVRALERQVAELDARLADMPEQVIELGRRERRVRILSEVLVLTEQRLRQEELRQALTFSNVQVIDPPALRYRPVWPRKKLGLAVGLLLASTLGLLAVVVAERADRTVRSAAVVRDAIGAPVLAAVVKDGGRVELSPAEARAVLAAADAAGGAPRLTIAAVDDAGAVRAGTAHAVARALTARASAESAERAGAEPVSPIVFTAPLIDGFPAATEAAAFGVPVVLVVEFGRTRVDGLRRAAALLEEAGAAPAGAVMLCERKRDISTVWA